MELIDNVNKTLKDDLTVSIQKDSKISIAAACFSIYAFQELKRELKNVDELRFIFTSPTFIKEKAKKEKREFYIPRQTRERSLYGSEFEVKLRNEMTQRAIAKECAEWIRKKATFKSNVTSENMMGFMNVDSNSYMPLNGFTTIDLGCERGNNAYYPIQKTDTPMSQFYLDLFEQIWNDEARLQEVTDEVVDSITTVYSENSPDYIYFVTLYNIFNEFLEDVSEDVLPNEATGFKDSKIWNLLYNFQKDAVLAIINKLEKYNGCILADSVGLGKTFTSLAVIKYYENRNKSVLVLCPKKLANNWNTYKDNYVNNPIAADRMRYDVLFHTDLSREDGTSNGLDLDRLNWGNYDLVGFVELLPHANGDGTHKYHAWRWSRQKIVNESYNLIVLPNSSGGYEVYTRIRDFNTTLLKDLITNVSNGDTEVQKLFGGKKYFDYPKSVDLLKILIGAVKDKDALILDFFSGSATTAHATMQLNREDGGNRQYIMVQIPDGIDEKSEAYKDGYHNLCEIGKERIRLAGAEIKEADIGFRVLKLDSSNMKDIYYNPAQIQQQSLFDSTDNIKEDRTPEDLLFQVMLDLGILLSSKIEEKTIAGKKVFNVADGFLIACFDNDVTEKTVKAVAQEKPYYAVFRDSSMANDSVATNFEQIFATYSPETVRKVL